MKNIIIGTAGHIDHGKTTLIKALTGRNTDRWEEEQRRGITIDLGFTYFDLKNGDRVGIIDVPGHEKFINNMVAGVVGMDLVMLVVAADEGIMPQTREHMDILGLLGIEKSILVINKCDLVDEEWLELVEEEIKEELEGTFLEDAPIVEHRPFGYLCSTDGRTDRHPGMFRLWRRTCCRSGTCIYHAAEYFHTDGRRTDLGILILPIPVLRRPLHDRRRI